MPEHRNIYAYPVERPRRDVAAPARGGYVVRPNQLKQVVWGLGFEIQCDSIAPGNAGINETRTSVPHDLTPPERKRLADEMLRGFRYCRLAGGLYWRGLDAEGKTLQPRWPEQLTQLKALLDAAGVEGLSLEYWSPPPYWKANRTLTGLGDRNTLRCFGPDFANDPDYRGDVDAFLADFAEACRRDVQTLEEAGLKVDQWGLQNEPQANNSYPTCTYTSAQYIRAFKAVAPVIRRSFPAVRIIADSSSPYPRFIAPMMQNGDDAAKLVDLLVVHAISDDSQHVLRNLRETRRHIPQELPLFQNEYEYWSGPANAARCHNTVQNIMNWFQLVGSPTWYWIHILKPIQNTEASGYALGFWRPIDPDYGSQKLRPDQVPTDDGNTRMNQSAFDRLPPGHWEFNDYNWNALVGFLRHMPWDSTIVEVEEAHLDHDMRICAFKRPDGKLVIVLANRSYDDHTFHIDTGLRGATFKGYRYSPDDVGPDSRGVEIGSLTGPTIAPTLGDLTWAFWVQQ